MAILRTTFSQIRILRREFYKSCVCQERLRQHAVPLRATKKPKAWNEPMGQSQRRKPSFVDWRRVRVKAGNGGDGLISTLSIFAEAEAGPDGGNGGNGGHVLFKVIKINRGRVDH